MSSTTLTETLSITPTVYGKIRYVASDYTPTPITQPFGLPALSEFSDERVMPLHDMRPLPTVDQLPNAKEGTAQLLTHGFTAVNHPSVLHSAPYTSASWRDPESLQKIYVPEVEEMLKRITGGKTVITETLLSRGAPNSGQTTLSASAGPGQNDSTKEVQDGATKKPQTPFSTPPEGSTLAKFGLPQVVGFSPAFGGVPPAPKVHLDYAPSGARAHIRLFNPAIAAAYAPVIAAEDRLLAANLPLDAHYSTSPAAPRWAIYSVWRPLKTIRRDPLAMCDTRSFAEKDYVPIDVPAPTMDSEGKVREKHNMKAYVGKGRDGHRWFYVSEQKPEEVLIVGLWDSDREGDSIGAGGAMHSSVELEGRDGEEPRESLELRCLVIW